jgi:hypothetical protein
MGKGGTDVIASVGMSVLAEVVGVDADNVIECGWG